MGQGADGRNLLMNPECAKDAEDIHFEYDELNRLTASLDPLVNATYFAYDKVGNLTARTDGRGAATYYTYDALYRRTRVDYPQLDSQSAYSAYYSYDKAGNLLHMEDPHTLTYYQYDALDRLTEAEDALLGKAIYYEYDAGGNRAVMVDPEGVPVYYSYDAVSKLTEVKRDGTVLGYYVYDAAGRRQRLEQGNGVTAYYQYDAAGRLTSLYNRKSDDTIVSSFDYAYDKAGRRTSKAIDVLKADASRAQHTIYYQYDATGQVVVEDRRQTSDLSLIYCNYFTYDKAGNRTKWQRVEPGLDETTYYTYDEADELLHYTKGATTTYFTYDGAGNTTSRSESASVSYYDYDADNMLVAYADPSSTAYYRYDACPGIRRRVESTVDGATSYFAYDDLNNLLDYDGSVTAQRTYTIPFLDDALALHTGAATYDYALDALGSVYNLLDSSQTVQNHYLYEAFGAAHSTATQNVTNPLRFTCRIWLPESSLSDHRVRALQTKWGRFLQRDPLNQGFGILLASRGQRLMALIHARGSQVVSVLGPSQPLRDIDKMNTPRACSSYAYALNCPARLVDPTGMWNEDLHRDKTIEWAADTLGWDTKRSKKTAFRTVSDLIIIGEADIGVDTSGATAPRPWGDYSWHFSTTNFGGPPVSPDLRRIHADDEFKLVEQAVLESQCNKALRHLGKGLHPLQDIYSHSAKHHADTPQAHVTGPNAPRGTLWPPFVDLTMTHRPDWMWLWPADVSLTEQETRKYLKKFLNLPCNPCVRRL